MIAILPACVIPLAEIYSDRTQAGLTKKNEKEFMTGSDLDKTPQADKEKREKLRRKAWPKKQLPKKAAPRVQKTANK